MEANYSTTNPSRFGKSSIRTKLLAATLSIGGITLLVTAIMNYRSSSSALRQEAYDKLRAVGALKQANIETYYQDTRYEIASTADNLTTKNALRELSNARQTLKDDLKQAGFTFGEATGKAVRQAVREYYQSVLIGNLAKVRKTDTGTPENYMHPDDEAALLQYVYTVKNPAAVGSKFESSDTTDIFANPNLDQKFREAFSKTAYAKSHSTYHPYFNNLRSRYGYYDTFLVDPDGFVVYTTFKELDFHGNLKTGPERDTGLGKAFAAAWAAEKDNTLDGHIRIVDFAPYPKSYDAPASFVAAPVYGSLGQKEGVLIYQLPVDKINNTMTSNGRYKETGLGDTGESFLIGNDLFQRTDSRYLSKMTLGTEKRPVVGSDGKTMTETTIGVLKVETEGTKKLFGGGADTTGTAEYQDYRGTPVLGFYSPLQIKGLNYGIVTKIDQAEAFAPVFRQRNAAVLLGAVMLGIIVAVGLWLARQFAQPIVALADAAKKFSAGDNTARAPIVSHDEIGNLADTFNQMVKARAESQAAVEQEARILQTDVQKLLDTSNRLAQGDNAARAPQMVRPEINSFATQFNAMMDARVKIQQNIEAENQRLQNGIRDLLSVASDASDGNLTVRASVTEGALGNVSDAINLMLENVADLLKDVHEAASRVATSAMEIQASSEQLSQGSEKQTVEIVNTTSAVQEMAANIESVAGNAQAASEAAARAKAAAEQGAKVVKNVTEGMERIRENVQAGAKKIKRLGERSMEISSIINTISQISAQTDMLALNAAIEAARAGEHGRGFTVVAEEVRKLAERAAGATKEIEKLIAGIQAETNESVSSMEKQTAEVEEESLQVLSAGDELTRIRESSVQSAELVNEISLAAKQQVRGANGVVKAMETVSNIAQQAQSGTTQTMRATESLTVLSNDLLQKVGRFKIGVDITAPAPSPTASAAKAEGGSNGGNRLAHLLN